MTFFSQLKHQLKLGAALALIGITSAHAAPRIGVQLWSVKDEIKKDFEGTLVKIAELGIEGVEFAGELDGMAPTRPGCRHSCPPPACTAPARISISAP